MTRLSVGEGSVLHAITITLRFGVVLWEERLKLFPG